MAQLSYSEQNADLLLPGMCDTSSRPMITSRLAGGAVAQVSTITVDTVDNSTAHTVDITFDGNTITVTSAASDGTATTTEVAVLIQAAIAAESRLGQLLVATQATNVVTLTARNGNESFTLSNFAGGATAAATFATGTAAAAAGNVPFGRGVVQIASLPQQCQLPDTADDTLKLITATPLAEASIEYTVNLIADLDFDGFRETYTATITSDGTPTVAEICTAIFNKLSEDIPANTVTVADATTAITFTSALPNLDFAVTAFSASSTDNWSVVETTALVPLRFLGMSAHDGSQPIQSDNTVYYPGGQRVTIIEEGDVAVEIDANSSPSLGDPVFCRANATSPEVLGAFRDAQDAADCILIPNASWKDAVVSTVNGVRMSIIRLRRAAY